MMSDYDLRVQTVVDGILSRANDQDIDVICEPVFDDHRKSLAAFVHNTDTGRFGMVAIGIEDREPDELCLFTFWPKMYEYAKAEGFTKEQCNDIFRDKILKQTDIDEFTEFILSDETY